VVVVDVVLGQGQQCDSRQGAHQTFITIVVGNCL